jgi:integral membrane protein
MRQKSMIMLNFVHYLFKNKKMFKTFKVTAILEGISYLVLFSNMLFIKPNNLELYKTLLYPIGMSHGVLFIGYILLAFLIKNSQKWSLVTFGIVLIASVLPFGTFYAEKKYLKNV